MRARSIFTTKSFLLSKLTGFPAALAMNCPRSEWMCMTVMASAWKSTLRISTSVGAFAIASVGVGMSSVPIGGIRDGGGSGRFSGAIPLRRQQQAGSRRSVRRIVRVVVRSAIGFQGTARCMRGERFHVARHVATPPGAPRIITSVDAGIEVTNLTKSYEALVAVDKLSFSVKRGEVLGLVGPNGAGKTTTLRALAGIHPPTEGSVRICGADLIESPVEAKRHLAFMPDEPRLFDYLTVEEHLQFVARLYQVTGVKEKIGPLLHEFELSDKRKALPSELSRGMKQKLMIACGFIHDPDVLIFDEPLTGLDPLGIRRMKESIVRRSQAGASVILSSHLLHLVEELCDSVAVIRNGTRIAYDTIANLKFELAKGRSDLSLEEAFLRITAEETPAT